MPSTLITSLPPTPISSSTPVQPASGVRATDSTGQGDSQGFAKTLDNHIKQQDQKPADSSQATADTKDATDTKDAKDTKDLADDKDQAIQDAASANPAEAAAIAAGLLAGTDKVAVDNTPATNAATPGETEGSDGKAQSKGLLGLASVLDKAQQQGKDMAKVGVQDLAGDKATQDAARSVTTDHARKAGDTSSGALQSAKETAALAGTKAAETRETASALQAADGNTTTQAPVATHSFAEQLASKLGTAQKTDAPQFSVPTPAGNSAWAEDVGNRIVWMAGKDLGKAELILTPPHLGRVEVSLSVSGDQASASFVAATPAAREALEQALPKLRELMSQAGIDLSQANVSANNAGQQGAQEQRSSGGRRAGGGQTGIGTDGGDIAAVPPSRIRSGNGLVDTFA
jgi:flagellar hook-length control protein FliK